jgi:hypothetical protein
MVTMDPSDKLSRSGSQALVHSAWMECSRTTTDWRRLSESTFPEALHRMPLGVLLLYECPLATSQDVL